jgi:methionine-rich copper-binding protein CopC
MKNLLALVAITLFSSVSAHAGAAKFVASTPADGSSDSAAPLTAVVLEFSEAVQLHEVFIKKDGDKSTQLGNLPHNDAKTITIPAPSLTPGHYVLEWDVFTHDSRVLRGKIHFTVSAGAATA